MTSGTQSNLQRQALLKVELQQNREEAEALARDQREVGRVQRLIMTPAVLLLGAGVAGAVRGPQGARQLRCLTSAGLGATALAVAGQVALVRPLEKRLNIAPRAAQLSVNRQITARKFNSQGPSSGRNKELARLGMIGGRAV
jgi:hypothetical protein